MPESTSNTSVPLRTIRHGESTKRPLLSPDPTSDVDRSPAASSVDFVHVDKNISGTSSPLAALPHPDQYAHHDGDDDGSGFDDWNDEQSESAHEMPSDLRPPLHRPQGGSFSKSPLLPGSDKQVEEYESLSDSHGNVSSAGRSSRLRNHEADQLAQASARKRYTYAAGFLLVSLFAFAVQTETAVYIQHDLKWSKPFCMLYLTHGSWTVLWPVQLLLLRLQKWHQPWPAFWRRHVQLLRQTAQMVEHQTLRLPPSLAKKSPVPYFIRTVSGVTCALTVAGGSWYVAVNLTTASDLTAIYNCSAFFAYAFAVPMLHEKLRLSKMIAVGVAIIGVLVVAYGDTGTPKHGSKSGGGSGGSSAPTEDEASNRALGNIVIGVGSVLYGFYEVLYKKVACPPDGTSPGRGMIFANTFGSLIGAFTLLVLWIPLPIFHYTGIEIFEIPTGKAAWMLAISVLANATFSGCFLVLISLTSPVLSSVAALLTIFLVALCDELLPKPLHNDLTSAAIYGGLLIIGAFLLLSWASYKELGEEQHKPADEIIDETDDEDV